MQNQSLALTDPLAVWLQFTFCVTLIGLAGARLIRYGDASQPAAAEPEPAPMPLRAALTGYALAAMGWLPAASGCP